MAFLRFSRRDDRKGSVCDHALGCVWPKDRFAQGKGIFCLWQLPVENGAGENVVVHPDHIAVLGVGLHGLFDPNVAAGSHEPHRARQLRRDDFFQCVQRNQAGLSQVVQSAPVKV